MDYCTHFEELISAELDGELNEEEIQALHAHIGECENCRRYREALRSISGMMAADLETPPADMVQKTMAEIRKIPLQKKKKAKIVSFRTWGMVAAAAVVLVVGIRVVGGSGKNAAAPTAAAEAPMMKMAAVQGVPEIAVEEEAAPAEKAPAEIVTFAAPSVENGAAAERMADSMPARVRLDDRELDEDTAEFIRSEVLTGEELPEAPKEETELHLVLIGERGEEAYRLFTGGGNLCWQRDGEETLFCSPVTPEEFLEQIG